MFVPFSEYVSDTKQMVALVKFLKKGSASVASIIAHADLIQSALGQTGLDSCSANKLADISCEQVVSSGTSSWNELLPMIFTAVLVIATGLAFYRWLNRDNGQQNDEGDNEAVESHEAKVSDSDFWMELRHFDEDPLAHDEADGGDPDGFGRHQPNFEDWHMNNEFALLMVMQKFFTEMNTLGRITAWQTMWQLKQLFKVGVLQEQRGIMYAGLKPMNGKYTAFLDDDTFRAVFEPPGTYQEDFGELTRYLTRRYLSSHGFEGESYYKEILEFLLRDLDLEDLEQRQLQIDRDNDPSRHAEAEMVAARERAIATLEMEISAAHENNDLERAQWLQDRFDLLYVL